MGCAQAHPTEDRFAPTYLDLAHPHARRMPAARPEVISQAWLCLPHTQARTTPRHRGLRRTPERPLVTRHRLARAAAAAGAVALSAAWISAAAAPSFASATATYPHPFITVTNEASTATPNGGTLADFGATPPDTFTISVTGLTCQSNEINGKARGTDTLVFLTTPELNKASDFLSAITELDGSGDFAPGLPGAIWSDYGDSLSTDQLSDFTINNQAAFPGGGSGSWYTGTATSAHKFGTSWYQLAAAWTTDSPAANFNIDPGSYSLGVACADGTQYNAADIQADANGNPLIAWSTLTFDQDGNWTVTPPAPVSADTTATALTATLGSDQSSATLKATVTDTATSGTTPTGTVNFYEGSDTTGTPIATGKVGSDGTVTETVSKLTAGSHSYTAVFVPDDTTAFSGSTSTSASVTVPTPKTATTVSLTGIAKGSEIVWTATVQKSDGSTASDAAGTVTFAETTGGSTKDTGITVTNGVATDTVTGLDPATKYAFTATYVAGSSENYASSPASSVVDVTTPSARTDGTLAATSGSVINPGSKVTATFPAGAFGDGDSFAATVHSTPESVGTGTASSTDGSISFSFTVPADLPAGAHTLELVDTTDPTQTAETAAFTVTAAATTTTDTTGTESPSNTGDPAPNDPVSFATGLVARTASVLGKPAGAGAAAGFAGLAAAAAAVWFWRRRVLLKTTTVTKR